MPKDNENLLRQALDQKTAALAASAEQSRLSQQQKEKIRKQIEKEYCLLCAKAVETHIPGELKKLLRSFINKLPLKQQLSLTLTSGVTWLGFDTPEDVVNAVHQGLPVEPKHVEFGYRGPSQNDPGGYYPGEYYGISYDREKESNPKITMAFLDGCYDGSIEQRKKIAEKMANHLLGIPEPQLPGPVGHSGGTGGDGERWDMTGPGGS